MDGEIQTNNEAVTSPSQSAQLQRRLMDEQHDLSLSVPADQSTNVTPPLRSSPPLVASSTTGDHGLEASTLSNQQNRQPVNLDPQHHVASSPLPIRDEYGMLYYPDDISDPNVFYRFYDKNREELEREDPALRERSRALIEEDLAASGLLDFGSYGKSAQTPQVSVPFQENSERPRQSIPNLRYERDLLEDAVAPDERFRGNTNSIGRPSLTTDAQFRRNMDFLSGEPEFYTNEQVNRMNSTTTNTRHNMTPLGGGLSLTPKAKFRSNMDFLSGEPAFPTEEQFNAMNYTTARDGSRKLKLDDDFKYHSILRQQPTFEQIPQFSDSQTARQRVCPARQRERQQVDASDNMSTVRKVGKRAGGATAKRAAKVKATFETLMEEGRKDYDEAYQRNLREMENGPDCGTCLKRAWPIEETGLGNTDSGLYRPEKPKDQEK